MADGLDDLFGAIDGDESGAAVAADEANKDADKPKEAPTAAADGGEDVNMDDKESKNGDDVKESGGGVRTVDKVVYQSVMSDVATTSSRQRNEAAADAATAKAKPAEGEKKDENREISTGTSHDKTVRSYSAYPKNLPEGHQLPVVTPSDQPAKQYAFKLDPFQQQAVDYIEKEESVLVAAHTSAGKTAVAEYAIAKALNNNQRVIYTSPIKALSNQKYRDLQEEFSDVGLMTGDITINPTATALVMTTEILRSMLYRGSELMREVAWVVYDEVHYMRDSERGVVWEESIILLPHRVRFVFLSATIPNASQFADWICEIHHQPCHVVYTNYRPTPLQHYIFPQGGDGLHLVVDERGKFREANFQKAIATLQSSNMDAAAADAMLSSGNGKKRKRATTGGGKKNGPFADLHRIVKLIMSRNLNPVIIFSFSKKDCERYALALNQEDYTDDVEKDLISQVYSNAIDSLSEDDQKLPQVEALLPLLKRGIGIHHGGLLPILKEIVEILFSEGLIKALFATETFSIGINMPAKTVVFTNTRKWDGKDFRWVTSGEYIQMSGRAGRRGKDDRGIVIQMLDEKMEPDVCKGILYGEPDPLNSSYKISYNMLLNLMRVEDVEPEFLLKASFHQFQREKDAPGLFIQADELDTQANGLELGSPEQAELISQYYKMTQQVSITRQSIAKIVRKPEHVVKFLQKNGRMLDISINGDNYGWGILTSFKKRSKPDANKANTIIEYELDVLLPCVDRHFDNVDEKDKADDMQDSALMWRGSFRHCRPAKPGKDDPKVIAMRIFSVGLESIDRISAARLVVPKAIHTAQARKRAGLSMNEAIKRLKGSVPLLDPLKDQQITDPSFETLMERAKTLSERLKSHQLASDVDAEERDKLLSTYEEKIELQQKARVMRDEGRACQTIAMKDDLKKMKRVLKKLGHVDATGVIQTKGRTACEINTANELVIVELIFGGVFKSLTVEQCVSLMSAMTFDERNKDEGDPASAIKGPLLPPFLKLQETARKVAQVQAACGIEINEDEFVESINPGMMDAVFAWCKGVKFIEVQKMTGSFEGTTIRTLRRLEELVRQITCAAKAIGDQELQMKFEEGSKLLKRDIVFCSSLYL